MLAYAPRPTGRSGSPRTLMLVAAGHVVALALVLTARSEFVAEPPLDPIKVVFVDPVKPPPPPPKPDPAPQRQPTQSTIDRPPVIILTPVPPTVPLSQGPSVTTNDPAIGTAVEPQPPFIRELPTPVIVRKAARFITPADQIRPPYPLSKQHSEEEASLRLSLAIDARGRVTAVTAAGAADPVFLDAARRHIVRHWRYQPASEGGTAIASRIVVTLTFTLED